MMKRVFLLLLVIFLHHFAEGAQEDKRSHTIIVSIAPYKYFVDAIVGDTAKVVLLVPPGASFHTYEPSPKQIIASSKADLWFRIGETFETRAIQAFKSHHPNMDIIDLREGVDLILVDACEHCCCHHEGADLHIWLSPKMVKVQVHHIVKALMETYPEYKELYQKRGEQLQKQIEDLDREIANQMRPLKHRTIMVSHAAYAYFVREYDLRQLPIEFEGKDPTPKQLTDLLLKARAEQIKRIYIQNQYSSKGARLIAKELGAEVITLDPYSGDYFDSMRKIASTIAEQG